MLKKIKLDDNEMDICDPSAQNQSYVAIFTCGAQ